MQSVLQGTVRTSVYRLEVVSIPFKRESVLQVCTSSENYPPVGKCFNSLQTGKRIASSRGYASRHTYTFWFQFPSNGKVYPKVATHTPAHATGMLGFNSLQTGKCIQRYYDDAIDSNNAMFQFPSNGKAYPKDDIKFRENPCVDSFNSLQTGKRIQSQHKGATHQTTVSIPFKRESVSKVGSMNGRLEMANGLIVSIPFKRESVSKGLEILNTLTLCILCFNSLQTGKRIQSRAHSLPHSPN